MKKRLLHFIFLAFLLGCLNNTSAQTGSSLNFDGSDDVVSLGNSLNSVLDPINMLTVEAWVNPGSLNNLGVIIGNYNSDSNNGQMQFLLRRDNDQYSFWVDGGSGFVSVYSGTGTALLNTWQHVAGTWDGSELKIYVDGGLMATTTGVTGSSFISSSNTVMIGHNAMNENFTGNIDEMRIWSVSRTLSDIQSAMNCTVDQESTGLVAYYAFNDGLAEDNNVGNTILQDVAGNGYDGTLLNFGLTGSTSNFVTDSRVDYISLQSSIGTTADADRLYDAIAADFNGDGFNDLIVGDNSANTRLYLNDGKGNFSNFSLITTGLSGRGSAGDVDGDGDIDFAMGHNQSIVNVYINNGTGTFTTLPVTMNGSGTASLAKLVDVNGDSKPDLIIGNNNFGSGQNNEVWLNTSTVGNAAFSFSSGLNNSAGPRTSISVGDVDDDGDNDILTGGYSYPSALFLNNNNDGTFTPGTMPSAYSSQVELTDWDFDGDLDAMIYDSYNNIGLRISRNDGDGNFGALSSSLLQLSSGNVCYLKDLNGDGYLDAILSNWGGKGKIYLNSGCALVLQTGCEYNLGWSDNNLAIADFNSDGKQDIFCLARNHKSTLYLNYLSPATTPSLPLITSAPAVTSCIGTNAVLTATASGPETIEWYASSTGGSPLTTGSSYSVNASTGNHTYYVGAVNSNGCYTAARTAVNLTVNPAPTISAVSGNVDVCGDFAASFGIVSPGNNTYQWYYENSVAPFDSAMILGNYGETGFTTDTMTIQQLITNGYNNYFVYASVTNEFNCVSYSSNDTIRVNPLPIVGINSSATEVCAGSGVVLAGTGADTYSWSDGITDNVSFIPGMTHTYSVTGTDVNGCQDTENINITVNALPSVSTSLNGLTISVSESNASYQWLDCNNSNAVLSGETNQNYTPTLNGSYAVEVTANGCIDTSACVLITTVDINSMKKSYNSNIYPNPADRNVTIECSPNSIISVVSMTGQIIFEFKTINGLDNFDISDLSKGIYFVKIKSETDTQTTRLIVE